jgi:hypothetical protein
MIDLKEGAHPPFELIYNCHNMDFQHLQTFYHYKVNYFNYFFFIFGLWQPLS